MSQPVLSPPPVFSEAGAQNNAVVVREAQEWIEEVTGQRFGSSFKESLKDGVLLCELMKRINPGSISKINKLKSPIAHLDNIQQFLNACRELGMKDSQLFDMMDLQVSQSTPRKVGVKRDDADRKIRSVCVTLYWLGRTVADMEDYRGPQLDLSAFTGLVDETQYSDEESNSSLIVDPPEHYQLEVGNHVSSPDQLPSGTVENGMGLTFEQEQTADQLLADIQCAVDEMLQDFQSGYIPETPTKPEIPSTPKAPDTPSRMGVSVHMISRNGGFGFQVVGGADANYLPEVELVLPGSAAEDAGILTKDKIVSVNKEDVTHLSHLELVALIKKAGSEGSMLIGLIRNGPESTNHQMDTTSDNEELELSINSDDLQDPEDQIELESPVEDPPSTSQPPAIISYGRGQPLPTLVEYQEETMLEQITELYEKSPPPPDTPSPLPTRSTASHPAPVSDDRESIERDLQEIVLMEMAATTEQKQKAKDDVSSDDEAGELEDQIEELLSFGRASKSPEGEFHLGVDLPPPLFESPPPPMPTTEAPKRQLKKESPPPVKAKPKRPVSFVEATRLPPKDSEPERARSATPTKARFISPPPPTLPPTKSPSPVLTVKPVETIQSVDMPSSQPAPATIDAPSPQPASMSTPSPQTIQAIETSIPEPLHVDSPTAKLPLQAKSPSPQPAQASPIPSTPRSYASPVVPSSESEQLTPEPITPVSQAKEIGVISPDDVEIVGNVKIHRVQRTRWTPKGSATETVMTSPEELNRQKYKQHYTKLLPKLKDIKQTPPAAQNGYPEPAPTVQQISPMMVAPLRTSPGMGRSHANDQQKRYTQPASLANWQMPLNQEDKTFSHSSRALPQQQSPQRRTNWRSQEELRIKKNVAITPNGQQDSLWTKIPTTSRQASVPFQATPNQQQYNKTQSLPRGTENWRVNRTNTWSRGTTTQRPTDGQQSAFAIKPKSPYDLCSRCHKPLGTDTVMSIPNLRVSYHVPCFICRVCRAPLVRSPHNTAVIIKGMHPHCKYCGSNDQGVLTTEC